MGKIKKGLTFLFAKEKILTSIVAILVAMNFLGDYIDPYLDNTVNARVKRLERAIKVNMSVLKAESDLDKKMFKEHGISLYHCNKNSRGIYKFSFVVIGGVLFEAVKDHHSDTYFYINEDNDKISVYEIK